MPKPMALDPIEIRKDQSGSCLVLTAFQMKNTR